MLTAEKVDTADRDYATWRDQIKTFFAHPDEFNLASEIYQFAADFENGMTAKQSYDSFDAWVACDA
jgi:hypothetical protein